jgi:hypothetical protein
VTFNIPAAPVINNGDWFELSGIGGMTQLNGARWSPPASRASPST